MRRIERWRRVAALVACAVVCAARARAQLPILIEGLADGEYWATTPYSNLLTRNAGRGGELGRLQLWGAIEPLPGLVFFAQGRSEAGRARADSSRYDAYVEQAGVRYAPSRAFVVDAGRIQPVVGTYASRQFSNRNPLIGDPDGYSLTYPYGAQIAGEAGRFDYRAAMMSLPPTHAGYVPTPSHYLRPAIGAGITPTIGLRIGGSFTIGPYLDKDFTAAQLRNASWSSYTQMVTALDFAFSRGYLETHAEAARGTYEVPGRADKITGYTYYGEAKYTFTPRFFVATRVERNDYPFIRAFGTNWVSRLTDFVDGELGVGYRVSPSTLLKTSVRADRWWVAPGASGFRGQGGPAFAMQLSQSFDVMSWVRRQQ